MDKWAQRILAAAAIVFALSVAVYVLRPRPEEPRYQWLAGGSLFEPRTGTYYSQRYPGSSGDANTSYWTPAKTMPPVNQAQNKAPKP